MSETTDMHNKILHAALLVFSANGYHNATTKEIAKEAGCNTVTLFRHFKDKEKLFHEVIMKYHDYVFDPEDLDRKLSYINLRGDFKIMADYFFETMYKNIYMGRIFVSESNNFEIVRKYAWFIPHPLVDFVSGYLTSMYMDKIRPHDTVLIAESFISYLTRTWMRLNTNDSIITLSREIEKEMADTLEVSVNFAVDVVMSIIKT